MTPPAAEMGPFRLIRIPSTDPDYLSPAPLFLELREDSVGRLRVFKLLTHPKCAPTVQRLTMPSIEVEEGDDSDGSDLENALKTSPPEARKPLFLLRDAVVEPTVAPTERPLLLSSAAKFRAKGIVSSAPRPDGAKPLLVRRPTPTKCRRARIKPTVRTRRIVPMLDECDDASEVSATALGF